MGTLFYPTIGKTSGKTCILFVVHLFSVLFPLSFRKGYNHIAEMGMRTAKYK